MSALSTSPRPRPSQLWRHLGPRRWDAANDMRAGVWSASSPSYKEYHGGARTVGNGGCPRLIFCLPFKDEDDNHGDDDDRRNLSPSGSHYISNLQATTAGDGGRMRRRTFEDSFPISGPSIQRRRSWSAR